MLIGVLILIVLLGIWIVSAFLRAGSPKKRKERSRRNAHTPPQARRPSHISARRRAAALPSRVLAIDTETTGLAETDRLVSLGMILADTSSLVSGQINIQGNHWIFNPGIPCHPRARHIHGYSDALLAIQQTFADNQADILELIEGAELVVAHNAEFDLGFLNRELAAIGLPRVALPCYCTMLAHRRAYPGEPAALEACAREIGLARVDSRHGALEDAWLALMIYLHFQGHTFSKPFAELGISPAPVNLRPLPEARDIRAEVLKAKHERRYADAEALLVEEIGRCEQAVCDTGATPDAWLYRNLAVEYRRQHRRDAEIALLERYLALPGAERWADGALRTRLARTREIATGAKRSF